MRSALRRWEARGVKWLPQFREGAYGDVVSIRVSVLCHNRLLRDALARILTKRTDFEVVATHPCDLGFAPANAAAEPPAVLLLDSLACLPHSLHSLGSGSSSGSCRPLLLAMEDDPAQFLRAVRRGAFGYLLQDASAADAISAIRKVAEGQAVCPLQYVRILFDYVSAQTQDVPTARRRGSRRLSRREQQLIPFIERGLSNKEIAGHLHLSAQTIKNHIHRILRKTGASDRLGIAGAGRDSFSWISFEDRSDPTCESRIAHRPRATRNPGLIAIPSPRSG